MTKGSKRLLGGEGFLALLVALVFTTPYTGESTLMSESSVSIISSSGDQLWSSFHNCTAAPQTTGTTPVLSGCYESVRVTCAVVSYKFIPTGEPKDCSRQDRILINSKMGYEINPPDACNVTVVTNLSYEGAAMVYDVSPGTQKCTVTFYAAVIDDDEGTPDCICLGGASTSAQGVVKIEPECASCSGGGSPSMAAGAIDNHSVDAQFYLGRATAERSAYFLSVYSKDPSSDLAKPKSLSYPFSSPNVTALPGPDGAIRQIKVPQGLVNVKTIDEYEYHLDYYYQNDVNPDLQADGFYATNSGVQPFATWIVANPDGAVAYTNLWISEVRGGSTRVFKYSYCQASNRWDLLEADGQTVISTWKTPDASDVNITNWFRETVWNGQRLQKTQEKYLYRPALYDKVLIEKMDGDENVSRTTRYMYYSADPSNGGNTNKLRRIDYPDGKWVYFEYNDWGRKIREYSSYGNNPPPPTNRPPNISDGCKLTEYAYALDSTEDGLTDPGIVQPWSPRRTIVKVVSGGQWREISRSYCTTHYKPGWPGIIRDTQECSNPGAKWGAAGNVQTRTWIMDDGKPRLEAHGNHCTLYYDSSNTRSVVDSGTPNDLNDPEYVVDGTSTVTDTDDLGNILSRITYVLVGGYYTGIVLSQEIYNYQDGVGHDLDPLRRDYDVVGLVPDRVTSYRYNCCNLESVIDGDGTATYYEYDAMKRLLGTRTHVGATGGNPQYIERTNVVDGANRTLAAFRVGTDGSVIAQARYRYDVLGRLMSETNAMGARTIYTNVVAVTGETIRTNVYADGGTRVETYARDGKLLRLNGTAVFPVRYEYGIAADDGVFREFTKEIKLNADGTDSSEWTTNFVDGLGRTYKTVFAPRPGVDDAAYPPSRKIYFNDVGDAWKEVDPDGVTTLRITSYVNGAKRDYTITALSTDAQTESYEAIKSGLEIGTFQGGVDRITMVETSVVGGENASTTLRRTDTFVWDDGQTDGSQIARSEASVDGLGSLQTRYGDEGIAVTTHEGTTYGPGATRTVTTVNPDDSYARREYSYGRLVSAKNYNAADEEIGGIEYGYDAHGRGSASTDARNGTTSYAFNDADKVTSVTSPVPGAGQSRQITSTIYDIMGRAQRIVQPDGTALTNNYTVSGLLTNTCGSRTYPVTYSFDAQGRMRTMTTWTNFGSLSGAATTTWNYNLYRGWLDNKRYADNSGPDYTYTPGGRLKTRAWARTGSGNSRIVTTYTYGFDDGVANNEHGDLVGVAYSHDPQGTPGLAQNYDRRGQLSTVVRGDTTTTLGYNNAGQLLGEGYAGGILDGLSVTNYYDALLRRTNVSTLGAGVLSSDSYGYDWASRLMTATNESGDSATYAYLANSPLIQQIAFKNAGTTRMTTTKQYDFLNRLTKISSTPSSGTPNSSAYAYNSANQRIRNVQADGSYWRYQYDALGQVTSGIKYWPDQEPVAGQQFGYTFDTIGNRRSSKAGGDAAGGNLRSADYAVNALNEITSLSVTGAVDVMGLALATSSVTVNGQTPYRKGEYFRKEISVSNGSNPTWQSVTVASPGETSVTGNAYVPKTPEQFAYDADGNLTSDGRWTYVWDAENRLVQMLPTTVVAVPDGAKRKLDFVYDYKGRRIQKAVSTWNGTGWSLTVSNRFLYDGWNLVAELNATNNAVIRTYLWGLDLSGSSQGAGGVGGLLAISDASKGRHFVSYDGNGNVMQTVASADGNISAVYEYGPFGEVLRSTGPMANANPFRFSTKYQDDETDLLYYGYRYYNASTGSWNSREPVEELGFRMLAPEALNVAESHTPCYAFLSNDPIDLLDVLGLAPAPAVPPTPRFATRKLVSSKTATPFCVKQVLMTFDVAITDAANNPIAGVALTESITVIQRECVARFPAITGTATTNAKGLISDIYFVPFINCCCSGGFISLKQTITAGKVSAVFYTTIDKTGAWTGNLRSVFH